MNDRFNSIIEAAQRLSHEVVAHELVQVIFSLKEYRDLTADEKAMFSLYVIGRMRFP